jgi:hypothetical protein
MFWRGFGLKKNFAMELPSNLYKQKVLAPKIPLNLYTFEDF